MPDVWKKLMVHRPGLIVLLAAASAATAGPGEWRFYGGDSGGQKYSILDQIHRGNVAQLKPAWIFDSGDYSDGKVIPSKSAFETTPLMVDGTLYVTTSFHRLFALDPDSGAVRWQFDPKFDRSTRVTLHFSRGLSFWTDGKQKRLLFGDQQARLFSIDPATGKPDPAFGRNGMIDLRTGVADRFPQTPYGLTSPVCICGDTFIAGAWVADGEPQGPAGDIRGFDVRTGKLKWTFHTVPRPGEFGHETWGPGSALDRTGVNGWTIFSADPVRKIAYIPLTSPATDFYGGDRPGANLFGDSLVALDCETGKRRWHFQTVHHNLWDYDLPAQPVLFTWKGPGGPIDAVAQITKTGFVFLFNRETGKPIFDVEERPIPKSEIPGEATWPTQPFPVKPPPFARQSMTMGDLTTVTPESRKECLDMIRDAVVETRLFPPISEKLTVMFPGTNGGANWGGGSLDPQSNLLFVNSMDVAAFVRMVKRPDGSKIPYRNQSYGRFWDSNLYPCQQPPWGTLSAIDLNRGEIRWQVRLGEFDELTARGIAKTGTPNLGGSIATKGGLIFIGATNDRKFRAFDQTTGRELWTTRLPVSAHATPMTYQSPKSGRQFVVIAAGGGNKYNPDFDAKLIAFALPRDTDPPQPPVVSAIERYQPKLRGDYQGRVEKLPQMIAAQPVPFNHRRHSAIACASCHPAAQSAARAGLPDAPKCLDCHQELLPDHPAIRVVRSFLTAQTKIPWVRAYQVPDFVHFEHDRHTNQGIGCGECHGPVAQRDVIAKEVSTSMAACMSCHQQRQASVQCNVCHELGQ